MAAPREPQWTTHEKNALLAEIIKVNNPHPQVLLNVITSMNMSPRLEELPLPHGRSLNSCRSAFEAIRRESPVASAPGLMVAPTSSPLSAPLMTHGKRMFPFEPAPAPPGRQLAPKPPAPGPYSQRVSQIDQPPKKKRGRPKKEEAKAKAEAQGGAGESSSAARPSIAMPPLPTPIPVPLQPAEPTAAPVQTPVQDRPTLPEPQVSRMNISSMLAGTPTGPASASHSGSSSGKRRRGRSTRSEPGDVPSAGTAGDVEPFPEYESPYARVGGEGVDSPARAAFIRRREEPPIEEQQGPGVQQAPPYRYPPPHPNQQQQPPGQQP